MDPYAKIFYVWKVLKRKWIVNSFSSLTYLSYYGGKGLPFFWTHFPGAQGDDKDPKVAKFAYKSHKLVGKAFEILVPLHIGAVGFHYFIKAENIFRRINPLATPFKLLK